MDNNDFYYNNYIKEDNLEEIAELLPYGLEYYGTVADVDIFSNKRIENYVGTWLSNHPSTKSIANKIIEGINCKFIMIGYQDKSKFKFITNRFKHMMYIAKYRLFGGRGSVQASILAFYMARDNRLVILLDREVDILGSYLRDLPSLLIHELMHVCFHINNVESLNISMKKTLIPFYKTFTYSLDKRCLVASNDDIIKLISGLSMNTDAKIMYDYDKLSSIWKKFYNACNINEDECEMIISKSLSPFNRFFASNSFNDTASKTVSVKTDDIKEVFTSFDRAYRRININNILGITLCAQEAIVPSEVSCISNQLSITEEGSYLINRLNMNKYGECSYG